MSNDEQLEQHDQADSAEHRNEAPASHPEAEPTDVELRLRRDMERFREQARAAQAERDAVISAMRAENDARLIRSELRVAAIKAGIIDVDALRLADIGALSVDREGTIDGVDSVIDALKSSKPYLFDQGRGGHAAHATTGQLRRAPAPAQPDPVNARTLSREQWLTERSRMLTRRR